MIEFFAESFDFQVDDFEHDSATHFQLKKFVIIVVVSCLIVLSFRDTLC